MSRKSKPDDLTRYNRMWAKRSVEALAPGSLTGENGRWTLTDAGKVVSTWREADAPGLSGWLALRLAEGRGATHVAAAKLKEVERNPRNAALGGSKNKKPARETLERLMRNELRNGRDPRAYFGEWADTYDYTRPGLAYVLEAVEAEEAKKGSTA